MLREELLNNIYANDRTADHLVYRINKVPIYEAMENFAPYEDQVHDILQSIRMNKLIREKLSLTAIREAGNLFTNRTESISACMVIDKKDEISRQSNNRRWNTCILYILIIIGRECMIILIHYF